MDKNRKHASEFVQNWLKAIADWLCRQIDPELAAHFPQIWERWTNQCLGRMHPYIDGSGTVVLPEIINGCINVVAERFSNRPLPGQVRDSVSVWDRESFCDLLSRAGVDSNRIESVCRTLDDETVLYWQTREIMDCQQVPSRIDDPYLWGSATRFVEARELLYRVAPTDIAVLLCGETGSGKEVFARALHRLSPRASAPFVAINCGAISENTLESELFGYGPGAFTGALREGYKGKLGAADSGTLFLDEISELPHRVQVALLRFLESGDIQPLGRAGPVRFDVRLIVASQHSPEQLLDSGKLRPDFFYRVAVFPIMIPPLRERSEDLPVIVANILKDIAKNRGGHRYGVSSDALRILTAQSWRGNIRELKNLLERLTLLTPNNMIDSEQLQELSHPGPAADLAQSAWLARLQEIATGTLPNLVVTSLASFIVRRGTQGIRNHDFSSEFDVSESTARRHLHALCDAGVLRRVGEKKGTRYFCVP